ncbi:hypothetical protein M0G43_08315 [Subsaxibacter sp. CAU 1640]|uniref:hypothetical protein n=1 Tax=Subsaxibacter sp. CAU 1640 TaxID=2933271 RepID=UPI002006BA89|nr:hypothetical protein [Subsaxibacter sp. CAU 1640]MCK7590573.1 hypothetical protein [Subsaxibacter sp. CAU 1640]
MKNKIKEILTAAVFLFVIFIMFLNSYIDFTKQDIDLRDYTKISGLVSETGVGDNDSGYKSFQFSLVNYKQKLGVYRTSKRYQNLLYSIKVGDSVSVYLIDKSTTESINTDVIQIENSTGVILDKEEFEKRHRIGMYVALIGGMLMSILIYFSYKRERLLSRG